MSGSDRLVNVHIGEVKVTRTDYSMTTLLGSCIGIGFLWPSQGVYGLAHCLLPQMPESERVQRQKTCHHKSSRQRQERREIKKTGVLLGEGRYVDQAIESLLAMMNVTRMRDIRAVVAGGANMTRPGAVQPEKLVGSLNAKNAIDQLKARRIVVVHEDTGGESGRNLSICCKTGHFDVRVIPRSAA